MVAILPFSNVQRLHCLISASILVVSTSFSAVSSFAPTASKLAASSIPNLAFRFVRSGGIVGFPPTHFHHHLKATNDGNAPSENGDANGKRLFEGLGGGTGNLEKMKEQFSSLYGTEEIDSILNLHDQMYESEISDNLEPKESSPFSLHDLILQTIEEEDEISVDPQERDDESSNGSQVNNGRTDISSSLKAKTRQIRAIASDVDGTLLSKEQNLHPATSSAVKRAIHHATSSSFSSPDFISPLVNEASSTEMTSSRQLEVFFPATGKSRKGCLDSLGDPIGTLIANSNVPGVYIQGLYCVDGKGNVIFEQKLSRESVSVAEQLCLSQNLAIVGYDGDDLYTTELSPIVRHLSEHYGEPMPIAMSSKSLALLSDHEPSMHKLIIMDDDIEKLANTVRPMLEELAGQYGACVTQAIPTMLEWLPAGGSKANGVRELCNALGIDPETELMALGDAENDAEMLSMAAIGVAVGNCCPLAREAADVVMDETNSEGGAGLAIDMFGLEGLR